MFDNVHEPGYCSQSQRFLGSRDNDVILPGDALVTRYTTSRAHL